MASLIPPGRLKTTLKAGMRTVERLSFSSRLKQQLADRLEARIMELAIEITNICNADCSFCAYRYMKRQKHVLANEQFEEFLRRYAEYGGGDLNLTPIVGDPLVDKNLIVKIRSARRIKEIAHIHMFTNLIGLSSFDIKDLLSSGINVIVVSTCIGEREMYLRIFGVDRYYAVMDNLERLLEENHRSGQKVQINVSLRSERPYGKVVSSPDYKRISHLYGRHFGIMDKEYDNWAGLVRLEDVPKGQTFRKIEDMSEPCSLLHRGLIIFPNGDAGACWCRDVEGQLIVGNVFRDSLEAIWKGEQLRAIRANWWQGHIPPLCQNCYRYTSLSDFLCKHRNRILNMNTA
jgi:radical SAM protein with 4Fe4S-binding SPASM domain